MEKRCPSSSLPRPERKPRELPFEEKSAIYRSVDFAEDAADYVREVAIQGFKGDDPSRSSRETGFAIPAAVTGSFPPRECLERGSLLANRGSFSLRC